MTGCDACGWTGRYTSQPKADHAYRQHSCERTVALRDAYEKSIAREAAVDRTPKPCAHPRADHQHGTYAAYTLDRCRCVPCAVAASDYNATLKRRQAYGVTDFADAAPVRAHVQRLSAAGIGLKRITALTGINGGVLSKLVYGAPRADGTRRPPARRILTKTADAILALTPSIELVADGTPVDGTGTRRRIEALVAIGWSVPRISTASGVDRQILDAALRGRGVQARTARALSATYDRLWDATPPQATATERSAAHRARNRATAAGWVPPLAWDDDTIDDPTAPPAESWNAPQDRDQGLDEWLRLVHDGEDPARAATRVGVTLKTIERRSHDAGDTDARRTAMRAQRSHQRAAS